jgi:protease-4
VWTGRQAKQHQLVDELGGLERAVAIAKQRAKIPADAEVEVVVYPARKSFYELLSEQFYGGSADSMAVSAWLNANLTTNEIEALRVMRGPLSMFRRGEVLALMPFTYLR